MFTMANPYLIAASILSALAALAHLVCIAVGGPMYRAMGAGEEMAAMAEAGSSAPAKITLLIAGVLLAWSLYALSGAGVLPRFPLLRSALCAITAVYLLRALACIPMMFLMPGRSLTFWVWSSAMCAAIGLVHLRGVMLAWDQL